MIGSPERRAVEKIQPAVVAGRGQEILVLIANDDGRRVEVGAFGGEPVLDRQRLAVQRDDRVRVGSRGVPGGVRLALGGRRAKRDVERAVGSERGPGRSCDAGAAGLPRCDLATRPLDRQIERPHGIRGGPTVVRSARVDDAVNEDQRGGLRAGRQECRWRLRVGAVAREQRVQIAVASDDVHGIDAAEGNRRCGGVSSTGLRLLRRRGSRAAAPLCRRHLSEHGRPAPRLADGAAAASAASTAASARECRRRQHRAPRWCRNKPAGTGPGARGRSTGRRRVVQMRGPVRPREIRVDREDPIGAPSDESKCFEPAEADQPVEQDRLSERVELSGLVVEAVLPEKLKFALRDRVFRQASVGPDPCRPLCVGTDSRPLAAATPLGLHPDDGKQDAAEDDGQRECSVFEAHDGRPDLRAQSVGLHRAPAALRSMPKQ